MSSQDFSVQDVLAWARTKPADERYDYWCDRCAIGQFLVETGRAAKPSMAGRVYYENGETFSIPEAVNEAAHCEEFGLVHSFGRFVKRLETLCPETPVTRSDWLSIDAYLSDIEQVVAA